ncbi:GrpB family protein [Puia sp. P3]|uniref:GrpB family protein n=1 Tax=Puia sp. P3 TaxID=3423952 RepID=UPI003D680087
MGNRNRPHTPPDPSWPARAAEETNALLLHLAPFAIHSIEHFGSTSVTGLPAKPIIDLMTELTTFDDIDAIAERLRPFDWHYVPPNLTTGQNAASLSVSATTKEPPTSIFT